METRFYRVAGLVFSLQLPEGHPFDGRMTNYTPFEIPGPDGDLLFALSLTLIASTGCALLPDEEAEEDPQEAATNAERIAVLESVVAQLRAEIEALATGE